MPPQKQSKSKPVVTMHLLIDKDEILYIYVSMQTVVTCSSVDTDGCTDNLCLHGNCVDGTNGYDCVCFDGFHGIHCDLGKINIM